MKEKSLPTLKYTANEKYGQQKVVIERWGDYE